MQQYDVPELSVAVARVGALVYEDAFGFIDRGKSAKLSPLEMDDASADPTTLSGKADTFG
jgi:hypothetical protein